MRSALTDTMFRPRRLYSRATYPAAAPTQMPEQALTQL